jgi:hypothetical protein
MMSWLLKALAIMAAIAIARYLRDDDEGGEE